MSASTPRLPDELYVEVTNRCNSRCQTCIRTFETLKPPRDLTLDEFRSMVDQVPAMRRAVLHGVGEPLLNPDLAAMIGHLKQRPDPPYALFNSNALALTPIEPHFVGAAPTHPGRHRRRDCPPPAWQPIRVTPS